MNMLLHPMHDFTLIKQAYIEIAILYDLLTGQEAIRTNSVVEIDHHNIVVRRCDQVRSIEINVTVRIKASSSNEDVYG